MVRNDKRYYAVPRDVVTVDGRTIASMYIGWNSLHFLRDVGSCTDEA